MIGRMFDRLARIEQTLTPVRRALARPWPSTRRGFKLWLASLILGVKGGAYMFGDWAGSNTESALRLFVDLWDVPLEVCGAVMVGLCLFAAMSAYSRQGGDQIGYVILTAASVGWAGCFIVGLLFLGGPVAPSVTGAINYLLAAALLIISAADPEPLNPEELAELAGLDARSDEAHDEVVALSQDLHEANPEFPEYVEPEERDRGGIA